MDVVEDGNGNQLAWLGLRTPGALLLGSHLDSVPDGGAFDGPLGVVSSFAALDRLRADGFTPTRPIVVANFADEEGARFGIACAGSQLATGVLAPDRALGAEGPRRPDDGRGTDAARPRPSSRRHDRLARRRSARSSSCTSSRVATSCTPTTPWASPPRSGRTADGAWTSAGLADHAGATRMADRRDPMLAYAATALAARRLATDADARATFGRLEVAPGGTNAIPSRVRAWLDARAATEHELERLVDGIVAEARQAATADAHRGRADRGVGEPGRQLRRPAPRPARHAARRAGRCRPEPVTTPAC